MFKQLRFCLWITLLIASCNVDENKKDNVAITELPFQVVSLDNLDAFSGGDSPGDWKVVADVKMDRHAVQADVTEGKGMLFFPGSKDGRAGVKTPISHEDIDIRLDFMLSKGAEVLLYFQERYGMRLSDSWAQDSATQTSCGALRSGGHEIIAPLLNTCKAPGLWQHLYVKFKAPTFDVTGKQLTDAVFEEVVLNGKRIHTNVAVDGAREKNPGALRIAGGSHPVALRNLEYKLYKGDRVILKSVQYAVYKGLFRREYDTLQRLEPLRSGATDSLHWGLGDKRAQVAFSGTVTVPATGDYLFNLKAGGPAWLLIDDKEIVNNSNTRDYTRNFYGQVNLSQGDHTFRLVYANYDESLVLQYAGPGIPMTLLTAPSAERHVKDIPPFAYTVGYEPAFQRGFFTHHDKVNTYTMAVGLPGGLNYAYDLSTFSVLSVWRGGFIDVSNMWTERGESQMEIPLGAPLELPGIPNLLQLANETAAWTDTVQVDNNIYTNRGYEIAKDGLPVFLYTYKDAAVKDHITRRHDNAGLLRTVTVAFGQPTQGLYFLLGSGRRIDTLSDGNYAIDDKAYFIEDATGMDKKQLKVVKAADGRYELLLVLAGEKGSTSTFSYSIIW